MKTAFSIISFVSVMSLIPLRWFWWAKRPGLLPCAVFWTFALASVLFRLLSDPPASVAIAQGVLFVGFTMNGAVTLLNSGRMPVPATEKFRPNNVWTPINESTRLSWLGDHYRGFSIGDLFLLSSVPIIVLGLILDKM